MYIIIICLITLLVIKYISYENTKYFYTTEDYPELKILEDNYVDIANEIPEFILKDNMYVRNRNDWNNEGGKELSKKLKSEWIRGWQTDVWYNFPLLYHGEPIHKAATICPKTLAMLKMIPSIKIAGFSLLRPNSTLEPHTDEAGKINNTLAGNLLLTKDTDASVYVGNQKNKHETGKFIIFDSNIIHYADNNSLKDRVILYIEFATNVIIGNRIKGIGLASKLDYPTVNIVVKNKLDCGVYTGQSNNKKIIIFMRKDNVAECHYIDYDKSIDNIKEFYIYNVKKILPEENSIIDIYNKGCNV